MSRAAATTSGPAQPPLVSVIIPHYLGDVVSECLQHISEAGSAEVSAEIIVVDDQPRDDGSIGRACAAFPWVRVASTHGRHGFGAACNAGLAIARGKYVAILNNDSCVTPGWLGPLVDAAEADPTIGVLQSKVRSRQNPERFDYSGAAGGMMDRLGVPFAFGRLFDHVEADQGQYDEARDIFWAVGCAMFVRRSCLAVTGGFDEAFYMHMEEIDLCWRMHKAGFRVRSCPASVVLHENGRTLKAGSFRKEYLNHRNNLVLLLKNMPCTTLLWVMPARMLMVAGVIVLGIRRRGWRPPLAAIAGVAWVAVHIIGILRRRRHARRVGRVPDAVVLSKLVPRSIVGDYFVRGARTAADVLTRNGRDRAHPRP